MAVETENNKMVTLRDVNIGDKDEIIKVYSSSIYGVSKGFYSRFEMKVWREALTDIVFEEGLNDKENTGVVAVDKDDIVGYGCLNIKDQEIKGIYVLPKYKGRKVGIQILNRLEEIARSVQIKQLFSRVTLNVVSFYEKAGYNRIKDVKFRLSSDVELDCVYMSRDLY